MTDKIKLNVCGTIFITTKDSLIYGSTYFDSLFNRWNNEVE